MATESNNLGDEVAALKQKVEILEQEIAKMKAGGFITQRDLKSLVPAILADYQKRTG